jgi:hypothetical protein
LDVSSAFRESAQKKKTSAADTYFPGWGGALIAAALGAFFGLAFGGALPRSEGDYFFGPEERAEGRER